MEGLRASNQGVGTASAHSSSEDTLRNLAQIPLTTTRAVAMWTTEAESSYAKSDPRHKGGDRTSMTMGYQKDELRSISWILGFLRLPCFLSSYALYITLRLSLFSLSHPRFEHSLAFKEIIPRGSSFIQACAAGEVEQVRQLALSGQGSPSSIDENGDPALHVAPHAT